MKILIVRHAIAEDRAAFALTHRPDRVRPLTAIGRRKMKKNARGLKRCVPRIDRLATSPLLRALQTADILRKTYARLPITELPALAPGMPLMDAVRWLKTQEADSVVALVGHEPSLGRLAGLFLTGKEHIFLTLRKGGACLIEFIGTAEPGRGALLWALKPSHLRAVASSNA
jgi:phosphohistidine phosphatase